MDQSLMDFLSGGAFVLSQKHSLTLPQTEKNGGENESLQKSLPTEKTIAFM